MNSTITNHGFDVILGQGLQNGSATLRAQDSTGSVIVDQVITIGTASNGAVSIPTTTLRIPATNTVTKISLFSEGDEIWYTNVNYEYPIEGDLVVSVTFEVPASVDNKTNSTFSTTTAFGTNLLREGLGGSLVSMATLGGAPQIEQKTFDSPTSQSVSFPTDVIFNMPAGSTVTGIQFTINSNNVMEISNIEYNFENDGELSFKDFKITLSN